MIHDDKRTDETRATHTALVTAYDRMLSGWGGAKGGKSYCAWACRPEDAQTVFQWVRRRPDLEDVNIEGPTWDPLPGRRKGHAVVYVVHEGHPALRSEN